MEIVMVIGVWGRREENEEGRESLLYIRAYCPQYAWVRRV